MRLPPSSRIAMTMVHLFAAAIFSAAAAICFATSRVRLFLSASWAAINIETQDTTSSALSRIVIAIQYRSMCLSRYNGRLWAGRGKAPMGGRMSLNRITRRETLFVLGAAAIPQARADGGLLRATRVDHIALAVGDMDKAMLFYRRLFGNDVLKDSRSARRYLRLGPCYMAIAPAAAGEAKRIDHLSIGIENFNASTLKASLESAGFKVRESDLGLFVADPDGNSLQIWADESWKQLRNAAP